MMEQPETRWRPYVGLENMEIHKYGLFARKPAVTGSWQVSDGALDAGYIIDCTVPLL